MEIEGTHILIKLFKKIFPAKHMLQFRLPGMPGTGFEPAAFGFPG